MKFDAVKIYYEVVSSDYYVEDEEIAFVDVVYGQKEDFRLKPIGVLDYRVWIPEGDKESVRRHASKIVARVRDDGSDILKVKLPTGLSNDIVSAIIEGIGLSAYQFVDYKANGLREPKEVVFLLPEGENYESAMERGLILVEATNYARTIANQPPNVADPDWFEKIAKSLAKDLNLEIEVLDEDALREEGYNLILAVGQGSVKSSKIIRVTYKKGIPKKKIAFIGKGLTFDAGGLDLKTAASMADMKFDKSGASMVLGIVRGIAKLGLKNIEVHGILALAENMPDGASYRPGDVIRAKNGKTVEITNTDAEGRLALASALQYSKGLGPDIVVTIATLTGGAVVALGNYTAAVFTNCDHIADFIGRVVKISGEKMHRMPLDPDLRDNMKSKVADIVNSAGRAGSPITAALFLKEFVPENVEWLHIDIAGTAWTKKQWNYNPPGSTGFSVRSMIHLTELIGNEE